MKIELDAQELAKYIVEGWNTLHSERIRITESMVHCDGNKITIEVKLL